MNKLIATLLLPLSLLTVACDDATDPEIETLVAEAVMEEAFESELAAMRIDADSLEDDQYEQAFAVYLATHGGPSSSGPGELRGDNTIVEPPCISFGCPRVPVASNTITSAAD